ncbi:MAG: uroporphyrinogen-III synthase [Burkholderiales bacterium]|nr:uroporphyrinogen-III synthase [Burkholderiales bacterium]
MKDAPLAGLGILVTRPAHQSEHLANLIRQAGGNPILFPALEIVDIPDLQPLNSLIDRLDQFDLAIFISPNAVNKAMNLIRARRKLPASLQIAAIGKGSAKVLAQYGVKNVITPKQRFDSEALLELPELQAVTDKRIVIFRGDGGRELLGDELTRRGAQLEYAECYRRQKPQVDNGKLLYLWARNELHAITVTSTEVLHNLFDLVGKLGQQWLKKTPVFVPHERIAEAAREMGLEKVFVTEAGDEAMVAGLVAWQKAKAS